MGALIDLTGMKFGRLTVIERDTTPHKKGPARWICLCDCGTIKSISSCALRSGATQSCGCLNREIITGKSNAHNLCGMRFGRLTVVERAKNRIAPSGQARAMWLCRCDCGNTAVVSSQSLKTGHTKSCGCAPTKQRGSGLIDLTGKRFSKLLVLERGEDYVSPKGVASPAWVCKCDCGNIVAVQGGNLRNGTTKSCGCIKESKGEQLIHNFLIRNNIKNSREFSFPDLKSKKGNPFRFDFAILDENSQVVALIEYQGEQHYKDCGFGSYQREYSDRIKRSYCKKNHVPLYEIKYDADVDSSCRKLLEELGIPHANPVPSMGNTTHDRCNDYPEMEYTFGEIPKVEAPRPLCKHKGDDIVYSPNKYRETEGIEEVSCLYGFDKQRNRRVAGV